MIFFKASYDNLVNYKGAVYGIIPYAKVTCHQMLHLSNEAWIVEMLLCTPLPLGHLFLCES